MSWGTSFNIDIFLHRQMYKDLYELEDEINSLEKDIESHKATLKMYAATNIRDIVQIEFKEEPIEWLNSKINEVIELLIEDLKNLNLLYLYKEKLNESKRFTKGHIVRWTKSNDSKRGRGLLEVSVGKRCLVVGW